MEQIIDRLYVGSDADYEKVKGKGWSILRACKDGPGGHRDVLGYTTAGAPKDKNYYFVRKGNVLSANLIDAPSPDLIPTVVIDKSLEFIRERLDAGDRVLVACNLGLSRSPTIVLLYLRAIGELPQDGSHNGIAHFKKLYPAYSPGTGMKMYATKHYNRLSEKD